MKEVLITVLSFAFCALVVINFSFVCWLIFWKCCLSKFRFVRELLGGMSDTPPASETRKPKPRRTRRE